MCDYMYVYTYVYIYIYSYFLSAVEKLNYEMEYFV